MGAGLLFVVAAGRGVGLRLALVQTGSSDGLGVHPTCILSLMLLVCPYSVLPAHH